MGQLARILDNVHHIRADVSTIVQSESRLTLERLSGDIAAGAHDMDELWLQYRAQSRDATETALAAEYEYELIRWRASYAKTLAMLAQGDAFGAREHMGEDEARIYAATAATLRKLSDMQIALARAQFDQAMASWNQAGATALAVIVGGLIALAATALVIGRSITHPIAAIIATMRTLAAGDTSVGVGGAGRVDEIGDIARAVVTFKENAIEREHLRQQQAEQARQASAERREARIRLAEQFDASVREVLESVTVGAAGLEGAARALSQVSTRACEEAAEVDVAARDASDNATRVASATEELSASITEISRQVAESHRIAAEAATEARRGNVIIGELSQATAHIGEVVTLISAIAQQTNLLALNATIEAARAGDAGKGFAVVAGEVKGLASQTAKATEEISAQIASVQAETHRAVEAIGHVGDIIERLAGISATVAAAVHQQEAATDEIARSVDQAARGTAIVSGGVGHLADAAQQAGEASSQVLDTAARLADGAGRLQGAVDGFVARMRNPDLLTEDKNAA